MAIRNRMSGWVRSDCKRDRRPSRIAENAQISLDFRWRSGGFGLSEAASAARKSRYRAGFEQWDRAPSHDYECALEGVFRAMDGHQITGSLRVLVDEQNWQAILTRLLY